MHYPTKKIKRRTNVSVSNLSKDIIFSTFYTGLFYFLGKKLGGGGTGPPGPSPCYGTETPNKHFCLSVCLSIIRRMRARLFFGPHLNFEDPVSRGPFHLPDLFRKIELDLCSQRVSFKAQRITIFFWRGGGQLRKKSRYNTDTLKSNKMFNQGI